MTPRVRGKEEGTSRSYYVKDFRMRKNAISAVKWNLFELRKQRSDVSWENPPMPGVGI